MDFRILGPLEVVDNGREPVIAPGKQRALLAILLLHANEVVSSDRLIEELWGDQPPASAAKSLQVHVSRLRRALEGGRGNGADSVVVTRGGGYLVRVGPGQLDLGSFERLLQEGSDALVEGDPERALELLREALGLWRGPPLAEFAYQSFAQRDIARLDELHLTAIEQRIEAELALGRHAQLIAELESLVELHPFRERLHSQFMLALYRAGRQAEALEAYQAARRTLVDELGIEPGRELEELQRAILAHEPSLDRPRLSATHIATRADDTQPPEPQASGAAPHSRRRRALAAAGLVVAGLVLAVVVLLLTGDRHEDAGVAPLTGDSQAVVVIDPDRNEVVHAISVGAGPGPLAYDRRSRTLWVGNLDDETVTQVDTRSGRPRRTVAVGNVPDGLAAADGKLWVAGHAHGVGTVNVRKLDGRFYTRDWTKRIPAAGPEATDLALAGKELWVGPSFGLLTGVDARTGAVRPAIDLEHKPSVVAAASDAVWVADDLNTVTRVDAETGLRTAIPVGNGPAGIALGEHGAWVTLKADDSVARLDPTTGSVSNTIPVGRGPTGVAVGAGAVWVANADDGTLSRIDPETNEVVATIRVGASPQDIVVGNERVWVSVRPTPTQSAAPGGTARIQFAYDPGLLDPAVGYSAETWMIGYATGAKLFNYPDSQGPAGLRLVPEVATALPRRSSDGRTYTFKIRKGFRFSPPSNEPVTAETFKHTIERALSPKLHGPGPQFLRDVFGADAFALGSTNHIAGITARGDTLTFRLSHPSGDFTSRIATPLFAAVPTDTPTEAVNTVSSAGPYYRASYLGDTIVLRRNPNYHGGRPRRLREIRIRVKVGERLASTAVVNGTADYAVPSVSIAGDTHGLVRRFGPASPAAEAGRQRYFINQTLGLQYLDMNTKRDLFASTRMRRAVNYAIDRRALARADLSGGLTGATPTDQYLPPGMPGFRDARIYPLRPNLTKARRLAGPGRRTAVLYAPPDPSDRRRSEIVKTNLSAIGIDVQVKILPEAVFFRRLGRTGEPYDLALGRWYADYADPVTFLGLFDPRSGPGNPSPSINYAHFDDPAYTRRLAAAERLSAPARYLAYGRLESDLARHAAPWAAFANPVAHDFFSARLGCQVFHPIYSIDLAALCLQR